MTDDKQINIETEIQNKQEGKIQYILNEQGELVEIPKCECRPVQYPIKYKLRNAFEVFVRVDGTDNYWISNYGRCVNNLKHEDKNTFYRHKDGNCHYTIYEVEKTIVSFPVKKQKNGKEKIDKTKKRIEKVLPRNISDADGHSILDEMQRVNIKRKYVLESTRYKRETSPAELAAEAFLVRYGGRTKVWHKDGDESNNWYKNLLYVSNEDYKALKAGKITWQELNLEQEYIEYENRASMHAYKIYNGILTRCGDTVDDDTVRSCYDKSTMWQGWLDNPRSFVRWYLEHYYECDDEEMDVDKDLFGDGLGMYCPDFCCILPKGLNTLLANSKKHYKEGQTEDNTLPLGVRYSSKTNKYYGEIQFTGSEECRKLSEWDTAEEAFAEYKIMKQADIMTVVARYKDKIPEYIYKRFFAVDVKPY